MSDSCCGGSAKSAPSKVATTAGPQAAAEQPAAKSQQSECCNDTSECCNDKPAKSEKHGCGC
ncbi:MAG TPA: hypothetical protein VIJ17_06185 [Pseudolabrys sp.]